MQAANLHYYPECGNSENALIGCYLLSNALFVCFIQQRYHIHIVRSLGMKKHINRIPNENEAIKKHYNQYQSSDDEWSHLVEMGQKIKDSIEADEREIFFSDKKQPATKQEIVEEKSTQVKDHISNTNQYQKFVNVLLHQRLNDIKRMLDNEKRFCDELRSLEENIDDPTKTSDSKDASK
jgi:hypothetical protein